MNSGSMVEQIMGNDTQISSDNFSKYDAFKDHLSYAADKFKLWDPNATYRIISHLDADGISSAAIIIKLLNLMNRKYTVSILPYLDVATLEKLKKESYSHFIFLDLGSGHNELIKDIFNDKFVLILDHHTLFIKQNNSLEEKKDDDKNKDYKVLLNTQKLKINANPHIIHVNPHIYDIDGGKEISGSGVTFYFARHLNKKIDALAHIAIVGAIGDLQENFGFKELNDFILKIAQKQKTIKTITGLRLFGVQTKPLHKILEYCTDPFIPGVSGSESGALQFLTTLGINPRTENRFKKLIHLSDADIEKLVAGLIIKTQSLDSSKIIGPVYIIRNEKKESPTRDAKEFATLLNACGRLKKSSLGIGVCLNIDSMKKKAFELSASYKSEIVKNLKWVEERLSSNQNIGDEEDGYLRKLNNALIINAKNSIRPTMIGTTVSIFSRSSYFKDGTCLLGMSRYEDGNTKISLRSKLADIDLREFLSKVLSKLNLGETGGHKNAAGAIIPTIEEESFVEEIVKQFNEIDNNIKLK